MKYQDKTPLEQIHENLDSIQTELLARGVGLDCMDERFCTCLGCALGEIQRNLEVIAPRQEKTVSYIVYGERKGKHVFQEFITLLYIDNESESDLKKRIMAALVLDSIENYEESK